MIDLNIEDENIEDENMEDKNIEDKNIEDKNNSEKQKNETREELKMRLKQKINQKKMNRTTNTITRKKNNNINDSLKKIGEIFAEKNIQTIDQIDNTLIETIMTIISKTDLELIINNMQNNSQFKNILQIIYEKTTTLNLE